MITFKPTLSTLLFLKFSISNLSLAKRGVFILGCLGYSCLNIDCWFNVCFYAFSFYSAAPLGALFFLSCQNLKQQFDTLGNIVIHFLVEHYITANRLIAPSSFIFSHDSGANLLALLWAKSVEKNRSCLMYVKKNYIRCEDEKCCTAAQIPELQLHHHCI